MFNKPAVCTERRDNGMVTVLVVPSPRGILHTVFISSTGVRTGRCTDKRALSQATYRDKPYPPRRAARRYLAAGKNLGITRAAKRLLREVVASTQEAHTS